MSNKLFEKLIEELRNIRFKIKCFLEENLTLDEVNRILSENGVDAIGFENISEGLCNKIEKLPLNFSGICFDALNGDVTKRMKLSVLLASGKKCYGDNYEALYNAINFVDEFCACFDSNGINSPINDISKFYAILSLSKLADDEVNSIVSAVICFNAKYSEEHSENNINLIKQIKLVARCYSEDYSVVSNADCREYITAMNKLTRIEHSFGILRSEAFSEDRPFLTPRDLWLLSGGSYDSLINNAGDLIRRNFYIIILNKIKKCFLGMKNLKVYDLEIKKEFICYCMGELEYARLRGTIPGWNYIHEMWAHIWDEIPENIVKVCEEAFKQKNSDKNELLVCLNGIQTQLELNLESEKMYIDVFSDRGVVKPVYDIAGFFSVVVNNPLFTELEISRILGLVLYYNAQYLKKSPHEREKFKNYEGILKLAAFYSECGSCNRSSDDISAKTEYEKLCNELLGDSLNFDSEDKITASNVPIGLTPSKLWELAIESAKYDLEFFTKKSSRSSGQFDASLPKPEYKYNGAIPAVEQEFINIVDSCFARRGETYTCICLPAISGKDFLQQLACMPDTTYNYREKRNIKDALIALFGITFGSKGIWLSLNEEERSACWIASYIAKELSFISSDGCVEFKIPCNYGQSDDNKNGQMVSISRQQYNTIVNFVNDLNYVIESDEEDCVCEMVADLISDFKTKLDGEVCWIYFSEPKMRILN